MPRCLRILVSLCAGLLLSGTVIAACDKDDHLRGINLPSAGFGSSVIPGVHGFNYLWPTPADLDLYAAAGFKTFRIAFLWERMQPVLRAPLLEQEANLLDAIATQALTKGYCLILDPHNYGAYRGALIGSAEVPVAAFEDLWTRLAQRYKHNTSVIFGLMNEPNKQKADQWAPMAQAAMNAIRATGARNLVLVPGTRWSGAAVWTAKDGTLSNAEALAGFKDAANNFAFEMHLYFDAASSGTTRTCVSETIGVERVIAAGQWLRQNGYKGFIGEFGASIDPPCLTTLDNFVRHLESNRDVWMGWTYWAGARLFGSYMFNIYPPDLATSAQLRVLRPHLE